QTIERWMACFKVLLLEITRDVSLRVGELLILPGSERNRVLDEFQSRAADVAPSELIHEIFERQVELAPQATAICYEGYRLTYSELNGRANQLARHLGTLGVGPNQLVGIYLERGLDVVVAVLGILKAGGAYLPLDPDYPSGRLTYMLKDSAP